MPSIAECIAVAKAYGRPPLEGLVAVGYLDPDDVDGQVVVTSDIGTFSDKELADELLRRAASGSQ